MTNEKWWLELIPQTTEPLNLTVGDEIIVLDDLFKKIVAEATRRGEVKAYENLKHVVNEAKPIDPGGLKEDDSKEEFWNNGYCVGGKTVALLIEKEIDAKLTSLKKV